MAAKKRGLGRGLDALLGGSSPAKLQEEAVQADRRELQQIPLDLMQRGKYQPRRDMDPQALEELAQSIKAQGVMQPIVVRLTQQQVAEAVGKSRATITNLLRLIGLPEEIKTLLSHGDLEMGHARALLGLPAERQVEGARHVVAHGLTVRQTEALVRQWTHAPGKPAGPVKSDPDIARLEQRLAERLGASVQIRHGQKGKGQLVIRYSSLDELQGVLAHIR